MHCFDHEPKLWPSLIHDFRRMRKLWVCIVCVCIKMIIRGISNWEIPSQRRHQMLMSSTKSETSFIIIVY